MPLTIADPDPSQATPGAASVPFAGGMAQMPAGPGGAATAEPSDIVAISPAALAQKALDASALVIQRLGLLLAKLDQATTLARQGEPLPLIGLMGEIGTAVREIGHGGQAPASPQPTSVPAEAHALSNFSLDTQAGALLRTAAESLALIKPRLQGAPGPEIGSSSLGDPAPPSTASVVEHVAGCQAQVALAMAQVEARSRPTGRSGRARLGRHGWIGAISASSSADGHGSDLERLLRAKAGFTAVLLCAAAVAFWVMTTLDLTSARIGCAMISGALCAAGAWRITGSRLTRLAAITVEPRRTP